MGKTNNFPTNNSAPSSMGGASSRSTAEGNASSVATSVATPQPVWRPSAKRSWSAKPRNPVAVPGVPRRYKASPSSSRNQPAAGTTSSGVPTTVPLVKSNSDNGKTLRDKSVPVFGGYYPLFDRDAKLIKDGVISNIPHTEGLKENGQPLFPDNPHHISAEVRRSMIKTYVRTSGQQFARCASMYCNSRDITVVKELNAKCRFSFLYGVYSSKDFYNRAPAIRRMEIRPEDEKVDLFSLSIDQFWYSFDNLDSVYMGDVYDTHMNWTVGHFIKAILFRSARLKEVVWFGHLMSTPIGKQGESGFYHYDGKTIIAYPHKDSTPSDVYTHSAPFMAGFKPIDLKCDVHNLGTMGVYVTFSNEGCSTIGEVMDMDRKRLGFRQGALWPFLEDGSDNLDFYVYEKYAYQVMFSYKYRADIPQSTSLSMLQTSLIRLLETDAVMKAAEAYPSAARVRTLVLKATFKFLCELFNERIVDLGGTVELKELHLSPWWQQLGQAVSSRASLITSTAVAVIGAFRVLQVLRPATVGFTLLSSLFGRLPAYAYSIGVAPVLEDLVFSKICEYVPPFIAIGIMALVDGVTNLSFTNFVLVALMYYAKLWLLSRGMPADEVDGVIRSLHTSCNLLACSMDCFVVLWEIHPSLAIACYLCSVVIFSFWVTLVLWLFLNNKDIPNRLEVWILPIEKQNVRGGSSSERARDKAYHQVEVEVPDKVEVKGEEMEVSQALLRDVRVKISDETRLLLEYRLAMEKEETSVSAHKIEYLAEIENMPPFVPPPRTAKSYAYAITKRILACDPPDTVNLVSGFNTEILRRTRLNYYEDPITVVTSSNVGKCFDTVVEKLSSSRKIDYQKWWDTMNETQKIDFMNGSHWDESMCTRSLMLKLDEGQGKCKPRCLINAHVSLSIFYKRHFDKVHGELKREPLVRMQGTPGKQIRTFTIFAAGLTCQALCAQLNNSLTEGWIGEQIRIIVCVAGDDTWLCVMEKLADNTIDLWYYETDATSFDASQGRGLLEEELYIYSSAGIPVELLRRATYAPISVVIDRHSKLNLAIEFRLDVTGRSTGFPNTSLGNSIVESLLVHECIWVVYKEWLKGNRLFREVLDQTDLYCGRAKDLGISFKKLYSGPVLEKASFLRGFFYQCDQGEVRWAPAIGRLAKLSKTLADLSALYPTIKSTRALHNQYLYDVFYGLRTYDWPESITCMDNMKEAPRLVNPGQERNPSALTSDEQQGQRYPLEVLQRRYSHLEIIDVSEGEEKSYSYDAPFLGVCSLDPICDILSKYYDYDYR